MMKLELVCDGAESLGIEYNFNNRVAAVMAHSPAARAGLQPFDRIVAVLHERLSRCLDVSCKADLIRAVQSHTGPLQLLIERPSGMTKRQLTWRRAVIAVKENQEEIARAGQKVYQRV